MVNYIIYMHTHNMNYKYLHNINGVCTVFVGGKCSIRTDIFGTNQGNTSCLGTGIYNKFLGCSSGVAQVSPGIPEIAGATALAIPGGSVKIKMYFRVICS